MNRWWRGFGRSDARAVERRVRGVLSQLRIPEPWSIDELIRQVSELRQREIVVHAVAPEALRDSPCGMWVVCEDADILVVAQGSPAWHSDLVLCHELAHMLLGHGSASEPSDEMLRTWFPSFDPDTVRLVFGRTVFVSRQEREAELLATLIFDQATAGKRDRMFSTFLG